MKKRIVFLVGPTAIGKSSVSIEFALKVAGEIISCDSMQVYKGMDIGTSKPSFFELERVPHHLISLAEPTEEFNVARFREEAIGAMEKVLQKGRLPVFVGGAGLYVRGLLDGLCNVPDGDKVLRMRLKEEAERNGRESLFRRLQEVDPVAAGRIYPNDLRRVIRALEVFTLTNIPISEFQKQTEPIDAHYKVEIFGLTMARSSLYSRIERRVDEMFAEGFVEEVKGLLANGMGITARQALGYKEIIGFLESECHTGTATASGGASPYSLEEVKLLIKKNTKRYAKRQFTWFRKDDRIRWFEVREEEGPQETAGRIRVEMDR